VTSLVRVVDPPARENLSPARGWVELLQPAAEYAKTIANTDFVPRSMRGNVAAISATILYGDEVGLGPMVSLAKIRVIDGTPTLYAEAQRALVLAAGHELWPEEKTATRVTYAGRRRGSDQIARVTWTLDDARRAGLAGREAWRKYPRQMLTARASAELCRDLFADVIGGLAAVEEIDDAAFIAGEVEQGAGRAPARRSRRAKAAAADRGGNAQDATRALALPPLPGEPEAATSPSPPVAESEPLPSTDSQRRRLHAAFTRHGIADRGDRLRRASDVIGRMLTSSRELTAAEVDLVLDDLDAEREGDVPTDSAATTAAGDDESHERGPER
jgi:hypothetical protein